MLLPSPSCWRNRNPGVLPWLIHLFSSHIQFHLKTLLNIVPLQIVHELLIAKFRLKLKKVGKTTRPFRYDLNQFPHNYTVKVTNRCKGLDLIDRVPEKLWIEVQDIVQEAVIKTIPKKKKCEKAKWLSEETLQIALKIRELKGKGKRKDIPIWMQSSRV